jgi:hypothetical protein
MAAVTWWRRRVAAAAGVLLVARASHLGRPQAWLLDAEYAEAFPWATERGRGDATSSLSSSQFPSCAVLDEYCPDVHMLMYEDPPGDDFRCAGDADCNGAECDAATGRCACPPGRGAANCGALLLYGQRWRRMLAPDASVWMTADAQEPSGDSSSGGGASCTTTPFDAGLLIPVSASRRVQGVLERELATIVQQQRHHHRHYHNPYFPYEHRFFDSASPQSDGGGGDGKREGLYSWVHMGSASPQPSAAPDLGARPTASGHILPGDGCDDGHDHRRDGSGENDNAQDDSAEAVETPPPRLHLPPASVVAEWFPSQEAAVACVSVFFFACVNARMYVSMRGARVRVRVCL